MLTRLGVEWYTDKNGKRSFDKNKILPIRAPKEVISGHETYVFGYRETVDDLEIHFINSWTKEWGDNGTGYLLWSEYKNFIDEMITFTDIPNSILEDTHNKPVEFKHTFTTPMKYGDRNDGVEALQNALTMTGDYKYEVTGYYGPVTSAAVLKFQLRECQLSWYEKTILRGQRCGPKTIFALNKKFGV
jgi:hypothetical protein